MNILQNYSRKGNTSLSFFISFVAHTSECMHILSWAGSYKKITYINQNKKEKKRTAKDHFTDHSQKQRCLISQIGIYWEFSSSFKSPMFIDYIKAINQNYIYLQYKKYLAHSYNTW